MGPPGRGHLEGRGRAGGYYFWARGTRTPPYGVTAVWCPYRCASRSHSVSRCLDVAMSGGRQVESCHACEPQGLMMCLNSLDATMAGRHQVEAWSVCVPHGHSIWTSPHTVTHRNLSAGAYHCT